MDQEHNGASSTSAIISMKDTGVMGKEACLTLLTIVVFGIIRRHSVGRGKGEKEEGIG